MLREIILAASVLLTFVYFRLTKDYKYWKKRGVSHPKPFFFFGNFLEQVCFLKSPAVVQQEIYNAGKNEPYVGVILASMKPGIYIRDPEIIRHILAKDFSHFHDRGVSVDEKSPLTAHLFSLEGARWRALRMKLTPTFTSGKMKNMLPLMQEVADEMLAVLDGFIDRKEVAEMREISLCFTTDVIGTCAFGIHCNSLRDPHAEFRKMGSILAKPTSPRNTFLQVAIQMFPILANVLPAPSALGKKMTEFFTTAISSTVNSRAERDAQRNDFLDLLIQIKKRGNIVGNFEELRNDAFIRDMVNKKIEDFEFTDNLMAAQAFVFFLAGFETSASTLVYALVELSHNPQLQETLQKELDESFERDGNRFTYDSLMKMPFLDKVVAETLRKYPPLPLLFRAVTQQYKFAESDLVLEKGMRLFIPVYAIHHNPSYYPDPERFDPERFTECAKESRHKYVYLPFGEGPRNCIAQRFGLLQVKLGLAVLLHRFTFELSPRTKYPLVLAKGALFLKPDSGAYFYTKRRISTSTPDL